MTLKTQDLPAGLYLVATPIGNLRDFSQRAIETLALVDVVLCEDTRMTGKLFQAHGIKAKLEIYNDHSAGRVRPKVLEALASGQRIALVSDAGMPLISDPGYKLVREAQDLGLYVTSIPGANAVLTALQLSGLPSDKFSFLGFLPPKHKARCDVLRQWVSVPSTLIAYETAPRLIDSLRDMESVMGAREAAVVRELTKLYEEVRRDTLPNLLAYYEEVGEPRGEIVIVIAPPGEKIFSDDDLCAILRDALVTRSVKDAASYVAETTGVSRKKIYDMALTLPPIETPEE